MGVSLRTIDNWCKSEGWKETRKTIEAKRLATIEKVEEEKEKLELEVIKKESSTIQESFENSVKSIHLSTRLSLKMQTDLYNKLASQKQEFSSYQVRDFLITQSRLNLMIRTNVSNLKVLKPGNNLDNDGDLQEMVGDLEEARKQEEEERIDNNVIQMSFLEDMADEK